ncbi:MAG: LysM peptidoglycan-binding domain-containing protein, partial [Oscillospiraceae bacterium]|nr:LysM peptidoglycan-binding domain-containing protein [Oscillospiraceae bacterium]
MAVSMGNLLQRPERTAGTAVGKARSYRSLTAGGDGYLVYLGNVLLPVTPSALELSVRNKNKTMDLVNGGEINLLKAPGLSEVSLEALLPNQQYPFARYEDGFRDAAYFLGALEELKSGQQSFPFRVLRTGPGGRTVMDSTSLTVSLEEYDLQEDAEKYGLDVSVQIKLRQFREYGTKIYAANLDSTGGGTAVAVEVRAAETTTSETDYVTKDDDTLYSIAATYFGDGSRWTEIYELNKEVIEEAAKKDGLASSSNGNVLYGGLTLKLPPKAAVGALAYGQGGVTGLGTGSLGTQENARVIYRFFKQNYGCPDELIAGALGNWHVESVCLDSTAEEGIFNEQHEMGTRKRNAISDPDGYFWKLKARTSVSMNVSAYVGRDKLHWAGLGLGQFTGPAATDLLDFAKHIGMNWYDLGCQLLYCVTDETFTARDGSKRNHYNDLFVNQKKHASFSGVSSAEAAY